MDKLDFKIETIVDKQDQTIKHKITDVSLEITHTFIDLKNKATSKALCSLGWTPPEETQKLRRQNDLYRETLERIASSHNVAKKKDIQRKAMEVLNDG